MNSISIIADPVFLDGSDALENILHLKKAILAKHKKILISSYEGGILSRFDKSKLQKNMEIIGYYNHDFSDYFSMNENVNNIVVENYGHKLDLLFNDSDAFIFIPSGINMITTFMFVLSDMIFSSKLKAIAIYNSTESIKKLYEIFISFSKQYGLNDDYFNQFIIFNNNPWALLNELEQCSRRLKQKM